MHMLQQRKQQEDVTEVPVTRPAPFVLPGVAERKQRKQMFIALALLMVALVLVIIKDRDFWFPTAPETSASSNEPKNQVTSPAAANTPVPAATPAKTKSRARANAAIPATSSAPPAGMNSVVTSRAVLPPLEVEVVAGNQHQTVRPGNNSIRVDVQPAESGSTVPDNAGADTNASEHVSLSPDTVKAVSRPVQPAYPVLAKQMRVQGSVVLQALIGKTGDIQDLHVLSGPGILSSAAMEAVKQWHFKPYYQAGQPVETEAHITVNFTISTY